jgi:hypothetical protein
MGLPRRVEQHCGKLHRMGKLFFLCFLYRAFFM